MILKTNDKLLITEEFLTENRKANPLTYGIFKLGRQIKVVYITDYSVIVGYDVFTATCTPPVAGNMRKAYLEQSNH